MDRRLTTILSADVVGYSRLMGYDESGTYSTLKGLRTELVQPLEAQYRGRTVKLMGDGALMEFASVVDAVAFAVAVQAAMSKHNADIPEDRRIVYRIGINCGDVIVEDEDIHGDSVNIASRLQCLAEPGGICISAKVYEEVRGKLDMSVDDIGFQNLKNITAPVRVYATRPGLTATASRAEPVLPDRPSIAVLPFNNMSDDTAQEYFADGMVEEIITALSRLHWLFVIARNSSFTFKGRAVDVKQVGRELGVRYVLEGSVRKTADKVRISGQLIDTSTGAHLWADRFDGSLEDVFDLQDQVTSSVVGAIAPRLQQAEIERSKRKPTESLSAYDYYLRGLACVHRWTREANDEALQHFARARELDIDFAAAYGMAARCYSQRKANGWVSNRNDEIAEAKRLARRAAALGKDDAVALHAAGMALAYVVGELDDGDAQINQALALDPNLAWAWLFSGWVKVWQGEPEVAIERVDRAMRLSPYDPHICNMQAAIASAHFFAGRHSEAFSWAQTAVREQPNHLIAVCIVAASGALSGRLDEAQKAVARLRSSFEPDLRIARLHDLIPCRRSEDLAMLSEGLEKAGLTM